MTALYPSISSTDCQAAAASSIQQVAERRLQSSSFAAVRDVRCEFDGGELHLYGTLPTQYLKQIALAAATSIEGVRLVDNQIQVRRSVPPRTARRWNALDGAGATCETQ
jgi:osmotically-inducible protein OsmY